MRRVKVAAAQLGSIPHLITKEINAQEINATLIKGTKKEIYKAKSKLSSLNPDEIREYNVDRMCKLMAMAAKHKADLIVFPELALTSFFPYFWIEDEVSLGRFFESDEVWRRKIYSKSEELNLTIAFGYAVNDDGNYNVFDLYSPQVGNSHIYKKVHIPGFEIPRHNEKTFQFERRYFKSGNNYPVWDINLGNNLEAKIGMIICHDRRYSNPYLIMGLKKVEIILNGYNTPFYLTFNSDLDGDVYKFHYFPLQAQAITEGTFIISVARAGDVFGHRQIGGTCIISPDGEIMAKTEKLGEDMIFAELDLNWCKTVRDQKYQGERSEPQVIYQELRRYIYG